MKKTKKQPLTHKNSWWHNLPHKWFWVFQLLFPIVLIFIATSSLPIPLPVFLGCLIGLWIAQWCFIKHYYGWKTVLFAILSIILWYISLAIIYFMCRTFDIKLHEIPEDYWVKYCSDCVSVSGCFCDPPTRLSMVGRILLFCYFGGLFFAPIIPQFWRLKHHAKKQ